MTVPTRPPHRLTRRSLTRRSLTRRRVIAAGIAAAALTATTACGGSTSSGGAESPGGAPSVGRLQIMAPADPGGGWDQTARALAASFEADKLAKSTQVSNVGGAGGTVGLAQLKTERSKDYLMVMGLVMVGAIETNSSQATLADTTPIARLTAEDEVVVVPKASPYRSIDDLVADMKERGGEVSIAGGSAGGTDHIVAALIAQAGDVPVEDLNYIAYSGGGESLASLLGNQVSAGISGIGEYTEQIASGDLRALAVSGSERVDGVDAPTLTEAGYDVELSNWRGVVAPPGISEDERADLLALVEAVHSSPAWEKQLANNDWDDTYLAGDDFDAFLKTENARVSAVLKDIGLT